jgi:ethanolamine utilization protein EutN
MQLATVIGHATSTIKHPSMTGLRLVLVQPLGATRQPEADPLLVVDKLGSSPGHTVIIDSDGKGARELVGDEKTPVRWFVVGLVDE